MIYTDLDETETSVVQLDDEATRPLYVQPPMMPTYAQPHYVQNSGLGPNLPPTPTFHPDFSATDGGDSHIPLEEASPQLSRPMSNSSHGNYTKPVQVINIPQVIHQPTNTILVQPLGLVIQTQTSVQQRPPVVYSSAGHPVPPQVPVREASHQQPPLAHAAPAYQPSHVHEESLLGQGSPSLQHVNPLHSHPIPTGQSPPKVIYLSGSSGVPAHQAHSPENHHHHPLSSSGEYRQPPTMHATAPPPPLHSGGQPPVHNYPSGTQQRPQQIIVIQQAPRPAQPVIAAQAPSNSHFWKEQHYHHIRVATWKLALHWDMTITDQSKVAGLVNDTVEHPHFRGTGKFGSKSDLEYIEIDGNVVRTCKQENGHYKDRLVFGAHKGGSVLVNCEPCGYAVTIEVIKDCETKTSLAWKTTTPKESEDWMHHLILAYNYAVFQHRD